MKLILITGFLGAGKTTFLTNLLEELSTSKIGIIVNEFGEKGIDGTLIKKNEVEMLELNNGSVFCSCIKENFIDGLLQMAKHSFDYVFVEASGLADPSNIKTIINSVNNISETPYDYSGSICLIDGMYFLKQIDLLPAIKRQIQYSSVAIINKVDLQTSDQIDEIERKLHELNENVTIYKTSFCKTDFKQIISNLHDNNKKEQSSTNTRDLRPKTLVLRTNSILDLKSLKDFLSEINGSTYRIKGFAKTQTGIYQISSVNRQLVIAPWEENVEETELVIISSVGIRIVSVVTRIWKKYFKEPMNI